MSTDALEGGCACGALRYRLSSPPMFVNCCHCRDCQRQTGTAFVLNALIERDRVEVVRGEPRPTQVPTDSGQRHLTFRCPECQTAVWSEFGERALIRFVRVGTLDEPSRVAPDVHIYVRSKLPWVGLPPGARAFETAYTAEAEWPPESLARLRALQG